MTFWFHFKAIAIAYYATTVFPEDVCAETKTDYFCYNAEIDYFWKGSSVNYLNYL